MHKSHVFLHCHCRYFSSVTLETNNVIYHDKPSELYVKRDHTCSTCRRTCLVRTSSDRSNSSQSPELSYIFLQHPCHEIVTPLRLYCSHLTVRPAVELEPHPARVDAVAVPGVGEAAVAAIVAAAEVVVPSVAHIVPHLAWTVQISR